MTASMTKRSYAWFTLMLVGLGMAGAMMASYLPLAMSDRAETVISPWSQLVLYLGFFFFFWGLGVLIGYLVRWLKERIIYPSDHRTVNRQAVLLALGLTTLMVLLGMNVLTWWDGLLLVIALTLVEISFHTRRIGGV